MSQSLPIPSAARTAAGPLMPALIATLLLTFAALVQAAEPAGRAISIVGEVRATGPDGAERMLAQGDAVDPGDALALGDSAHAQLRMRDDALIELEAGSRFAIERYGESGDAARAAMRLLRGAMRTITGAIGDAPEDEYRVDTPVATIGVRGTQYALHYCDSGCAREQVEAGLYGRVDEGTISASNRGGSDIFERTEYFYVASIEVAPKKILRPPDGILDGGAVSRGEVQPPPDEALAGGGGPEDGGFGDGGIGDGVDDAVDGVTDTVDRTLTGVGGTVGELGAATGDTVGTLGDAAGGTIGDLGGAVGGAIGGDVGDAVTDTGAMVDDTLTDTTGTLDDTLTDTTDMLGDTLGDPAGTISEPDSLIDETTDITEDLVDGLTDTTEDTVKDTTGILDDLLGGGD